jgi:hypothetical protein
MRTFLRAVRNRRSHTTEVLDDVLVNPAQYSDNPHYDEFKNTTHHLDTLDEECRAFLLALSPVELEHIDDWDNDLKEMVRLGIVEAVDNSRRMRFYWELVHTLVEVTDVDTSGDNDDIIVTFGTPEVFVRAQASSVVVGVGSAPPENGD